MTAGKRLTEWHREIEKWSWPTAHNAFETPGHHDVSEQAQHGKSTSEETEDAYGNGQRYWGSLAARRVIEYENRIEEIRDTMLALELDDLKMHIRDAHFSSAGSRSSSITASDYSEATTTSYRQLDDFTAILTTTVMQALPVVFRLEALLSTWQARLATLRAVPGFTNALDRTQQEMAAACRLTNHSEETGSEDLSRPLILGLKARLESQIRDLGQRLDYMLDLLEGRQDSLPEVWIDHLERLEAAFCDWAVEAERTMTNQDFRSHDGPTRSLKPSEGASSILGPDTMLGQSDGYFSGNDEQRLGHRPTPLKLTHSRNHSNALSDFSDAHPGSATSDYFSDMSSPEIQDASRTEFFEVGSPVEVTTPSLPRSDSRNSHDTVTRQSSQRTERGNQSTRSRSSTILEPTIAEDGIATVENRPAHLPVGTALHDSISTPPIPIKSRHRFEPSVTPSPTKGSVDQLEARINSILTDIPADIQLAQDFSSKTPPSLDKLDYRKPPTPRMVRAQNTNPSPALRLIRAEQKGPAADSDVKVYHLQRTGQGPPIKLHVRLVGESGERVMVRIGGGWADLAEYLKEYATHHRRRTVSGGQFDFKGLPHSQASSPATAPLGLLSQHQTPGSRPQSSDATSTPHAADTRPTSRDSNLSRKSWVGDGSPSLGLAGPKSRKSTVSPNKQAWVDTMMEKARTGSGEKKKSTRDGFGDLGIVGGTKRLFMKGRKVT